MRRGMGLADLLLYIFALMLIFMAIVISALGTATESVPGSRGLIRTAQIDGDDALQMFRISIVDRSIRETIASNTIRGQIEETSLDELHITGAERIAFAASYRYSDVDREEAIPSSWGSDDLRAGSLTTESYPMIQKYSDDPIVPYSESQNIGFERFTGSQATAIGRQGDEERLGFPTVPGGLVVYWVPGYVGPERSVRGVQTSFSVPLEVSLDAR